MEIWKAIPGYEELYEVSSKGNVRSLNYNHTKKTKELKLFKLHTGYIAVNLFKNKKIKLFQVQQLVAIAFLQHVPCGNKTVIDHINSNKLDNRLENLKIITNRENCSKEKTLKSGLPVGVVLRKNNNKYQSRITINNKLKHLGYFFTPEEASAAYQKALIDFEVNGGRAV